MQTLPSHAGGAVEIACMRTSLRIPESMLSARLDVIEAPQVLKYVR